MPTPKNRRGQRPSRDPAEASARLAEKAKAQKGSANQARTGAKIREETAKARRAR